VTPEGITPAAAAPAAAAGQPQSIEEAAQALEGVFLSMLTDELFKGTEAFSASPMYGDLATEQLADELGRSGGLGLADVLIEQLGGGDDVDQR
jgi:flagellar protein FlgJ